MSIKLFPKQIEVLKQISKKAKLIFLHGSIRASKTILQSFLAAEMACTARVRSKIPNLVACARDQTNCNTNIADNCRRVWCDTPEEMDPKNKLALCPLTARKADCFSLFGVTVYCAGFLNSASYGKLLGRNIDGALVDEVVLAPQEFMATLSGRLSAEHSMAIITTNPSSTRHYIKTEYIDKCDGVTWQQFSFKLDDNPSISEETKNHLKRSYTGVLYRRYILGEWCDATGKIYPFFNQEDHCIQFHGCASKYIVGFDYGQYHKTAAMLIGMNPTCEPPLWVEKEFVTDPNDPRYFTPVDIVNEFIYWLRGYSPYAIYVDPAASSAKTLLAEMLPNVSVCDAENSVADGIACVMKMFCLGYIKIMNHCKFLIDEMYEYAWDEQKSISQGKDVPLKEHDDCVDALRYALFSYFGLNGDVMQLVSPRITPIERPRGSYQFGR